MARGGARAGGGRPKGSLDQNNKQLREMILEALEKKGGANYLADQADKSPAAFLALLGKVLPTQVSGPDGGPVQVVGKFTLAPLE